jgi:acetyl-CoA C-acetyltransferase
VPIDPRTPVLVGAGVTHQRFDDPTDAREAVELMALAAARAADDAGAPDLLAAADTVIVPKGSWRYSDPARLLATRFGADGARTVLADLGVLQLTPFTRACSAIGRGEVDVALIAGGEAKFRDLRGMITGAAAPETEQLGIDPDDTLVPAHQIVTRQEVEAKLVSAPLQYSVLESALRFSRRESVEENARATAELWAAFSRIATANPDAWRRDEMTVDFLAGISDANPMIAAPYRKWNCSQWNVDQAAAFLLCSVEVADRLGVPDDRRVFPLAAVEGNHMVPITRRAHLHRSPQVQVNGERLAELSGIAVPDVDHVDLYSCFPVAVRVQAAELGLSPDRPLTVTGGMAFGGGPLNNYTFQSIAKMVEVLRADPGAVGLTSAISGMITKQGMALWSTRPADRGFRFADVSDEAAARTEVVEPLDGHSGPARVEGYTVAHVKGAPVYATVLARTESGERCVARCDDADLAAAMVADEWCGRTVTFTGSLFEA